MVILPDVTAIHLHMRIRQQEKDISFIHTSMMPIHCQALRESRSLFRFRMDIDAFTELLWSSLNEDNKVSLFVRYIDIETGEYETRIVNKNQ